MGTIIINGLRKKKKGTDLFFVFIPFCERNYNLIELGPKGTGKSHIYSEFSPHGILISGGEVTVPKLFVNNASGKIGLVGYWDVVAFDEFAGKQKRVDKTLNHKNLLSWIEVYAELLTFVKTNIQRKFSIR